MIFHFLWAYAGISSRYVTHCFVQNYTEEDKLTCVLLQSSGIKNYYGIDHQVSPREDLVKYGAKAVADGKITQAQLNQMKRVEVNTNFFP